MLHCCDLKIVQVPAVKFMSQFLTKLLVLKLRNNYHFKKIRGKNLYRTALLKFPPLYKQEFVMFTGKAQIMQIHFLQNREKSVKFIC